MSASQHTPEPSGRVKISLHIGQRVRHRDFHGKRITGIVFGLSMDSERVLMADIALDEAIVLPPLNERDRELRIYRQHVPAHELAPFDERDELLAEMLKALREALQSLEYVHNAHPEATGALKRHEDIVRARAAIARASRSAA